MCKRFGVVGRTGTGKTQFVLLNRKLFDSNMLMILDLERTGSYSKYQRAFRRDFEDSEICLRKTDTEEKWGKYKYLLVDEAWCFPVADVHKLPQTDMVMLFQYRHDIDRLGLEFDKVFTLISGPMKIDKTFAEFFDALDKTVVGKKVFCFERIS